MRNENHVIVPGSGTTHAAIGENIDNLISKMGRYDRVVDNSEDERMNYYWSDLNIRVTTDLRNGEVTSVIYSKNSKLYLGDIPVFESPNLVVLLGMHDPHPLLVDHYHAFYPRLGITTEIPPPEYGYSQEESDDFRYEVAFLEHHRLDQYLKASPAYPEYDWRQWLKPNLNCS